MYNKHKVVVVVITIIMALFDIIVMKLVTLMVYSSFQALSLEHHHILPYFNQKGT